MPSPPPMICYEIDAPGIAVGVLVYGRDSADIAASIWDGLGLAEGQIVRLAVDPRTLKINGQGWINRANGTVQTTIKLMQRRI